MRNVTPIPFYYIVKYDESLIFKQEYCNYINPVLYISSSSGPNVNLGCRKRVFITTTAVIIIGFAGFLVFS